MDLYENEGRMGVQIIFSKLGIMGMSLALIGNELVLNSIIGRV
jgi:hypothetical protein